MHPFLRSVVIGGVGLLIAGALAVLAVLGESSDLSQAAMLASALVATAVGAFLFVQGWIWSQRTYRHGSPGAALAIAIAGGLMVLLAAIGLAASVVLVLLFYAG